METNSGLHEATLPQVTAIAENLRKIGGGIVLLTGGEPFLRKDLPEMVRIFKSRGLDVRLQTWGEAKTEAIQSCYDAGARDLNISLDSLDPNKQDYINSVPGSWARAIDAVSRVSKIFAKDSGICSLGCVLSRFNFREIPAILEFATEVGWYLSLVPVHIAPADKSFGFRSYDTHFKFRPEDHAELRGVIDKLIEMKRTGYMLFDAEAFLESTYNFLVTGKPTWRKDDICDSPNLYFAIRPNGDFMTCCDHPLGSGAPSLADPNFHELYNSGVIHKIANPIVKKCTGCHYGSYPEVTLSVRDFQAFWHRFKLAMFRKSEVIRAFETNELRNKIETIKLRHPSVYTPSVGKKDSEINTILEDWRDEEKRKSLIREDNARRVKEGRIRKRTSKEDDLGAGI